MIALHNIALGFALGLLLDFLSGMAIVIRVGKGSWKLSSLSVYLGVLGAIISWGVFR